MSAPERQDIDMGDAQSSVRATAYNVAVHARDLIAVASDDAAPPGTLIEATRRLRADALIAVHAAVQAEVERGMDWASVAKALGLNEITARRMYDHPDRPDLGVGDALIQDWYARSNPDMAEGLV